jgi:RES domain-containing protein
MIVFRLSSGKFQSDLSGKGAELSGGRWNSKGVGMLYTSQSQALAFAEIAMHIPFGIVPKDYHIISIFIPASLPFQELSIADLPPDWRTNPHSGSTQIIGDQFIAAGKYAVLRVPSAVVSGDYNYLVNPKHPQASKLEIRTIEPFEFDSRFVGRIR